jgi:hypothetical protein
VHSFRPDRSFYLFTYSYAQYYHTSHTYEYVCRSPAAATYRYRPVPRTSRDETDMHACGRQRHIVMGIRIRHGRVCMHACGAMPCPFNCWGAAHSVCTDPIQPPQCSRPGRLSSLLARVTPCRRRPRLRPDGTASEELVKLFQTCLGILSTVETTPY